MPPRLEAAIKWVNVKDLWYYADPPDRRFTRALALDTPAWAHLGRAGA